MRIITYLGFTLLSIFIQFCVMDFIQEKIQVNKTSAADNKIYNKKITDDLFKNLTNQPHALYYRTLKSKTLKRSFVEGLSEAIYNTTTIPTFSVGSTDISSTIFDILYDENTSVPEELTTESFTTTTEFDNITEITFFESKNKSSITPKNELNIAFSKNCGCNLLYKVCDINCCCDIDCTKEELNNFQCEKKIVTRLQSDGCISHLLDEDLTYGSNTLENLFCVVKTNLPEKHNIKKFNVAMIHQNKWQGVEQRQTIYEFKKTIYKQNDPIWLLKNGTIYYLDFPTSMINSYCTDRTPIVFLKDEKIRCMVKLNDLEMFHISKTSEESMVISATGSTFNSSTLNCSNLHCIYWTILVCDEEICVNYNKSLHEASCTDSSCKNVALKIDYYFYYQNSKIINATIKLHTQNISNMLPFVSQEVSVNFIMGNKTLDEIITLSGNPGYINNLPVIVSYAKSNFTDLFFNSTEKRTLNLPENKDGICVLSNSSQNIVRFGLNKRTKCRYVKTHPNMTHNVKNVCKSIQDNLYEIMGINKEISVSPFGNPYNISDENWLRLETEQEPPVVYGEHNENLSKLHCFNMITRISITFIFANLDEKDFRNQNKILSARYEVVQSNTTFNLEDNISSVLTIDINFIDATKPNTFVYAGSPNLNIHLPKDFFFPFPQNNCYYINNSSIVTIFCYLIILFANKITLE